MNRLFWNMLREHCRVFSPDWVGIAEPKVRFDSNRDSFFSYLSELDQFLYTFISK